MTHQVGSGFATQCVLRGMGRRETPRKRRQVALQLLVFLFFTVGMLAAADASISLVGVSSNEAKCNSIMVDMPAGVEPGDFLLAQVTLLGDIVPDAPVGWTLVRRDCLKDISSQIYYKFVDCDECETFAWGFSHTITASVAILAYSGVSCDPASSSSGATGNSTSLVASEVTAEDGGRLVAFFSIKRTNSLTTPEGMTQQYLISPSGDQTFTSMAADQDAVAGPTGPRSSTAGSSQKWVAQLVALRTDLTPSDPTTVSISPETPTDADDLTASASGSTSCDGGDVTYEYEWASSTDGENWSEWGNAGAVLSADLTSPGEQWKARARAVDANGASDWVESAAVAIAAVPTTPDAYEVDNKSAEASDIASGDVQNHTIHVPADTDWCKFSLTELSDVKIETSSAAGDTVMWLYCCNGSVGAYDDDGGTDLCSLIDCSAAGALPPGLYFIRVQSKDQSVIAAYTLSLGISATVLPDPDAYEVDDTSAAAKTIAAGEAQARTIHVPGNTDWAQFMLAAPSDVTVSATSNTRVWLYNVRGSMVASSAGDGSLAQIGPLSLAPGKYFIRVMARGAGIVPDYTLSLEVAASSGVALDDYEEDNRSAIAKPISAGATQNHSIHTVGDVDWAWFTVGATATVTATASGDTEMWLYRSSGALVGHDAGNGTQAQVGPQSLPVGTYFIRVQKRGNNGTINAYTLSLQVAP